MALTNFQHTTHLIFPSSKLKQSIKKLLSDALIPTSDIELGNVFSKQILSGWEMDNQVTFISHDVGYGLFAKNCIHKGDFIGCYTGLIKVYDPYLEFSDYLYAYPRPKLIDEAFSIDAEKQGNLTRFINHSFTPNLSKHYAFCQGLYHVLFLANKSIAKGDQLFFDYGSSYWHLRGSPILFT